jgi:dTDP-4-dehydrorhamnose reductase
MIKIVLFGSTGMLGRYVYKVLCDKYDIQCISRSDFNIENDNWSKLKTILNFLNKETIVINCAGIIPQKVKFDNCRSYIRVNTIFPHKLNEICKDFNSKFIHITTDCVYDGVKGYYIKTDQHTAMNIYGITKSEGEPDNTTVIRTSIIGEEINGKNSLLEWIIKNKNGTISGYTNQLWNGVTCLTLAKYIKNIIDNNLFWKGVKHIYSDDIVSKYELCIFINKIYELNINIIPHKTSEQIVNMTLTGNDRFNFGSIYEQINEQKEFNIY